MKFCLIISILVNVGLLANRLIQKYGYEKKIIIIHNAVKKRDEQIKELNAKIDRMSRIRAKR